MKSNWTIIVQSIFLPNTPEACNIQSHFGKITSINMVVYTSDLPIFSLFNFSICAINDIF